MKKLFTIFIAILLVATMSSFSAFAVDLNNSVGSISADCEAVDEASVVGKDSTQNKATEYELAIDGSTETAETVNKAVKVYATQGSVYSVKVPKTIILDGATGNGAYTVAVKGNISGNQTIKITPEATFSLKEQAVTDAKSDIVANVTQNKTAWTTSEITNSSWTTQNASISATLSAGMWKGNIAFTIELVNAI